jgi:hypothetical protein
MFIVAGACAGAGSSIVKTLDPSGPVRPNVPNAVSPKGLVVLENSLPGGGGNKSNCEVDPELKPPPMNAWPVGCGCDGRCVAVARSRAMAWFARAMARSDALTVAGVIAVPACGNCIGARFVGEFAPVW